MREDKGHIAELVILVSDEGGFVLMNFLGKIDLKKNSHLTRSVNIDGMEYPDKVKDTSDQKAVWENWYSIVLLAGYWFVREEEERRLAGISMLLLVTTD